MLAEVDQRLQDFSNADFEASALATLEQDLFYLRELLRVAMGFGLDGRSSLVKETSAFVGKLAQRRAAEMAKVTVGAAAMEKRKREVTREISQAYVSYKRLLASIEKQRADMKQLQTQVCACC